MASTTTIQPEIAAVSPSAASGLGLGAAIVAASGLFILYRETALGRRPTASLRPNAAASEP